MVIKMGSVNGKIIEIHDNRFGRQRYWAKVDGRGLFQRGRMRVRAFTTVDAAYKAAVKEARS